MKPVYNREREGGTPDRILSEEREKPVVFGKYSELRRLYLKEYDPEWYESLCRAGQLNAHLSQVQEQAEARLAVIMRGLLERYPAPDKRTDPLGWAGHMNGLKAMAEESILAELVYDGSVCG